MHFIGGMNGSLFCVPAFHQNPTTDYKYIHFPPLIFFRDSDKDVNISAFQCQIKVKTLMLTDCGRQ